MPTRDRRLDRAIAISHRLSAYAISEIRSTRVTLGLSQDDLGASVGISGSQVGRFERGELQDIELDQLCRLSAAVGLVPSLRLYPDGDPVRDVAQVRLLERLRARLPPGTTWRTEVPLQGRPDPRAWDAVATWPDCNDAFEAESRLGDLQAIERRILLKHRDDAAVGHVFLVVAATRANRGALALGREALRGHFPLDTREALSSLSRGRCPGTNGLLVL
jgi:transcriptional regulator with XRE-family HTH domain